MHHSKSPWINYYVCLFFIPPLVQVTKIEIFHKAVFKHLKFIQDWQKLLSMEVLDPEEASDDVVDDNGDYLDEDFEGTLRQAGARNNMATEKTKEVQKSQQSVKATSISLFMCKPPYFFIQGFNYNKEVPLNLLNHMYNFELYIQWSSVRRVISSYTYFNNSKYQDRILNPFPLYCIKGCIMEDSDGDKAVNNIPQRSLNLIYGSISSYSLL